MKQSKNPRNRKVTKVVRSSGPGRARLLTGLLACAMAFSTIGSEVATIRVYAAESDSQAEEQIAEAYVAEQEVSAEQEIQNQEIQNQEIQNQKIQNQEIQNQEIQNQEIQSQEIQSQEIRNQVIQNQEIQNQEIQNQEIQNQEAQNQEIQNTEEKEGSGEAEVLGARIEAEIFTVRFMFVNPTDASDSRVLSEQQIPAGHSATAPQAPDVEGYRFIGWSTGFDAVSGHMTVTALYGKLATFTVTVHFLYASDAVAANSMVFEAPAGTTLVKSVPVPQIPGFTPNMETVEINATENQTIYVRYTGGNVIYQVEHRLESLSAPGVYDIPYQTETLQGEMGKLSEAKAQSIPGFTAGSVENVTLQTGDTVIRISYARNRYTLSYDVNGGSYVAPQAEVLYGAALGTAPETKRTGHDFLGWTYYNADTGAELSGRPSTMPSHNVRAQAMWREAEQAEYRVVYWKQDITGGGYDFAESVLLRTRVGTTPTVAEKRYEHFHHARTEQGGAVTADGQTVYNVYHDRDRMSVIFKKWDNSKKDWVTVNTYSGLYGAPFTNWPADGPWFEEGDRRGRAGGARQTYLNAFIFPNSGNTYTLYKGKNSGSGTVSLWLEQPDGSYLKVQEVSVSTSTWQSTATWNFTDKFNGYQLTGYKADAAGTGNMRGIPGDNEAEIGRNGLAVYYARKAYTLTFSNIATQKSVQRKYMETLGGKDIPGAGEILPPSNTDSDYAFDGWYLDAGCQTPADFGAKMPANNMQVFAKWVAPSYTVTFVDGMGKELSVETVPKYGTVSSVPSLPDREDYTFTGWYTDAACTHGFRADTQITQDMTIHAGWKQKHETFRYTVYYKDGAGNTLADPVSGSADAYTTVPLTAKQIKDYIAKTPSWNLTLTQDQTVYTFEYTKGEAWELDVRYEWKDAEGNVHELQKEETVKVTGEMVTVSYRMFDGYRLTGEYQQTVERPAQGSARPEVTFLYVADTAAFDVQGVITKYDGTPYSVRFSGAQKSDTVRYNKENDNPSFTDAGEYPVTVTVYRGEAKIWEKTATVIIGKRNVILTSGSREEAFDKLQGTELKCETVDVSGDGFAGKEGATYGEFATLDKEGSVENAFDYTLKSGTNEKNYVIEKRYGRLSITGPEKDYNLLLVAKSASYVYDDTEKSVEGFESADSYNDGTLQITLDGESFTVSGIRAKAKAVDAGSYAVNPVFDADKVTVTRTRDGKDFSEYFGIETVPGTLTVLQRPVTIRGGSLTKTYDGNPLRYNHAEVDPKTPLAGTHYLESWTVSGEQTRIGESRNVVTGVVIRKNPDVTKNYDITFEPGVLRVVAPLAPPETPVTPPETPVTPPAVPFTPAAPPAAPVIPPALPDVLGERRDPAAEALLFTSEPAPDVLGARKVSGEEPDVLGSRRGKTGEATDFGRMIVLMGAFLTMTQLIRDARKKCKSLE